MSCICDAEQLAVFGRTGGFIQHEATGKTTNCHCDNNVYSMEAKHPLAGGGVSHVAGETVELERQQGPEKDVKA